MDKIINWLSGKKTYISAILLAIYGLLKVFGIISVTPEQENAILILLGALFGISLRAGITKSNCE